MPTVAQDKAITAAAKADPDAPPLTPKQLQAMDPMKAAAVAPTPQLGHATARKQREVEHVSSRRRS